MIITAGVPVIVQPDGLKERTEQPADTETLLYWEQQVDRGGAIVQPLPADYEGEYTHLLVSETGGWFHVRCEVDEMERPLPALGVPAGLALLRTMTEELDRIITQERLLMAANRLLEDRCRIKTVEIAALREEISRLEIANEQLERHLSPQL